MTASRPELDNALRGDGLRRQVGRGVRLGTSLFDQAIVSGTNFATGVIVARACGDAGLGLYGNALAATLILTEVHHALVTTPHQILSPRIRGDERRAFNGSALLHSFTAGALAAGGAAIAALLAPTELAAVLLPLVIALPLVLTRYFARIVSFTWGRPPLAAGLDGLVSLVQLGSLLWLWRVDELTPTRAVFVLAAANGAGLLLWLYVCKRSFTPQMRRAGGDFRRNWPLGRWLFVSGLLWTLGVHTYPWLVTGLSGIEQAGVWSACFALAAVANPVLSGVQNLVSPGIAHAAAHLAPAELRTYVALRSFGFGGLMLPFVLAAALFGEQALVLFGDEFAGHGIVVFLLALATLAHSVGLPAARGLLADGRASQDAVGNVVKLVVLFAVGIYLISTYGVVGAAASMLLGDVAANAYRCVIFYGGFGRKASA